MVKTEKSFSRIGIKNYLFENNLIQDYNFTPEIHPVDDSGKSKVTYILEFTLMNGKKLYIKDFGNKTFEWDYGELVNITNWEEFENCLQNLLKHYQL